MSRHMGKFTLGLLILAGSIWAEQISAKGEPIPVSAPGETYMAPKWSPDGSKLAVTGQNYIGITVLDFPSGNAQTLTEAVSAGFGMEWSPDGGSIATSVDRYEGPWRYSKAILLGLDGYQVDLNTESKIFQGDPKFSGSGDLIYMQTKESIATYSVNTQGPVLAKNLVSSAQQELNDYQSLMAEINQLVSQIDEQIVNIELSPSEMQLAYSTIGEQLWVVDIDGSNRRFLGNGTRPEWSSDNNWISCMVTEDDGYVFTHSDILVYNVKTGSFSNLTNTKDIHEMNPDWSPDGSWIAYETLQDGRIWVVQVEVR